MGKNAKFKKLRRLATQMPTIMTNHRQGEDLYGYEILKDRPDATIDKEPLEPKGKYHQVKTVQTPINHSRNLKKAYYRGGASACGSYVAAVNRVVAMQNARKKTEEAAKDPLQAIEV